MQSEKSEAIVIRLADFSESSKVVTCFTRDFGKISALAKGGKRLKSAFEAALDLLSHIRVVFIRKSADRLDLMTEAQLVRRFRPQNNNLFALYGGYYIAELLDGLTEPADPHPRLFDVALESLQELESQPHPELTLIRFQLVTLQEIGQLPLFDSCLSCGVEIAGNGPFSYWVNQGGLLCRACQSAEPYGNRLQAGTIAILNRLTADSPVRIERIAVTAQQTKEMQTLLTSAISHALGRRPKTLRYLNLK